MLIQTKEALDLTTRIGFNGRPADLLQIKAIYNGQIAQLVEQGTENPCVPGSIPGLATILKHPISKHDLQSITLCKKNY